MCIKRLHEFMAYFILTCVLTSAIILLGCSDQGIINPKKVVVEGKTPGELHNEIMEEYLGLCVKNDLFREGGDRLRVSWTDARNSMITAFNKVMQWNKLPYRVTEKELEEKMQAIGSMAESGVLDLFHQETITPEKIRHAAQQGFLQPTATKLARALEIVKMEEDYPHPVYTTGLQAELEELTSDPSVEIFRKSVEFWKEVQDTVIVDKEDDEEKDRWEDWWNILRNWWHKHEPQIREVYVGACDAAGGALGSGAGPGGIVLGAVLGTAAGTIAWPPPDSD